MKTTFILMVGLFMVLALLVMIIGFLRMLFDDVKNYVMRKYFGAFGNTL